MIPLFLLFTFYFLLFTFLKSVEADNPPANSLICPSELAVGIDRIVQRSEYRRSYWGIFIQPLESDRTLYRLNEGKFFIPASNVKLLTSAAALLTFNPDHRVKTPIYVQGQPPNLESLTLVGKGDPTITREKLQILARQLKDRGIRQISRLIIDDSFWPRANINKTWEWEDIFFDYAVPTSSVILNENAVTLKVFPRQIGQPLQLTWSDGIASRQWQVENRTVTAPIGTANNLEIKGILGNYRLVVAGLLAIDAEDNFSIAIPDPTRYFLDSLRDILQNEGITVKMTRIISQSESLGAEILSLDSEPLAYIVQQVNQNSHNLFAETLLQLLGGIEGLTARLTELGINADAYSLRDGSGLSRQNLVTPETFVQVLKRMRQTPNGEIYRDSLALAGINGTLETRFRNTPIQGRLHAKTGTLAGVVALSGYLESTTYDPLVFSVIVNHSDRPLASIRNGIDEIIMLLGQLKRC